MAFVFVVGSLASKGCVELLLALVVGSSLVTQFPIRAALRFLPRNQKSLGSGGKNLHIGAGPRASGVAAVA